MTWSLQTTVMLPAALAWSLFFGLVQGHGDAGVLGCSGFVRSEMSLSSSSTDSGAIDFSRIHVGLLTEHGSRKEMTDCAPSTGYFFLPVENLGKYMLKVFPPAGWTVSPTQVEVQINGKDDPCSLNEDIIFKFSGFSVTGKVSSRDKVAGPSGVHLELYRRTVESAAGETLIAKTLSDANGNFDFRGLSPGNFAVRIAPQSLESFSFESKLQTFAVQSDSVKIPAFVIIGYDVEGVIVDSGGSPIQGVEFSLLGEDHSELKKTVSNEEGKFNFANVSRGDYVVRAMNPSEFQLTLSTEQAKASVVDKNVVVEKFVVDSFMVRGQVQSLNANGKPVVGARVTARQGIHEEATVTGSDGTYSVRVRSRGQVRIQVATDDLQFDEVSADVHPGVRLPLITPQRFQVSGIVEEPLPNLRIIFQNAKRSKEQIQEEVSKHGKFEVFLSPGEYSVKATAPGTGEAFLPNDMVIVVADEPHTALMFHRARYTVTGKTTCMSGCDGLKVLMRDTRGGAPDVTATVIKGVFVFNNVAQGEYQLTVPQDRRCWLVDSKTIQVKNNIDDVLFQQIGFSVNVYTDHDTRLILQAKGTSVHEVDLKRGRHDICIRSQETLTINTEGCFGFKATPDVINAATDDSLVLSTSSFTVKGHISSKDSIPDLEIIVDSEEKGQRQIAYVRSQSGSYDFSVDSKANENLIVMPRSKNTFFDPPSLTVTMKDNCLANVARFEAREGVFIEGSIVPAVEGALVLVQDEVTGDQVSAYSEKDGTYKVGPFVDATPKKIHVQKDDYFFEESQVYGKFNSRKLSSITISVSDSSGKPLNEEVVISISGGFDYKSNSLTKGGTMKFTSLHPGEYFVKAFLKEWTFEPRNLVIQLAENINLEKTLTGKRVAFSATGQATFLNGQGAAGVVILAHGQGACESKVEDAVTADDGSFRLRGLVPGCTYALQSGSKDVPTVIPKNTVFNVTSSDTALPSKVVVHGRPEIFHISVLLRTRESRSAPMQVSLEGDNGSSKLYQVIPNQLTFLSPLRVIDNEYVMKIDGKTVKRIPKGNVHFHFIEMDMAEEVLVRRRESATRAYYIVPLLATFIAGACLATRYYRKKD